MEQKALQVGAAVLTLALLLRLGSTWEGGKAEVGRTLLFLSSGRLVTETVPPETAPTTESDPEVCVEYPEEGAAIPVFGESEEAFVQVSAAWDVDIPSLLQQPLQWDLMNGSPAVLILQ